ncbi:MAG: XrtA/PEP-CTERM system amidotransferase [Rhodovibrio sp.]|nr:XrtA/PEP-CTERM system amidotransferase [Rhodovibrio sp.]
MCGLAGLFDSRARRAIDARRLTAMTDSISHRGPDDAGYYRAPGIGLGHRRLSIIDLASGHQPLFNEDGTVVVVYNGEIYNFPELMAELSALGHVFATRCDTEVIVHAWEEWGAGCVERFRGMFAFALYDANAETLFLARDRMGIKPLYYTVLADGRVAFGSELKTLLVLPEVARELDPVAVEDFFALGYVPEPRSIYRDVHKLAPGHVLTIRRGHGVPAPRCYWDMTFDPQHTDEAAVAAELPERLMEAVGIRMIADVPLGAFLSGGVDSSAVVACMAKSRPTPVTTCAIGFGEADYDETAYAGLVAERYKTDHHARRVAADDVALLDLLPRVYDEPFADSSAIPTYRVCQEARRHVTVALSGDGGDELFAGYRRYRWHGYEERVRARLPQSLRGPLFGVLGRAYPKADWAPKPLRAKTTFQALARDTADGYFHSVCVVADAHREALYAPAFKRELQGYRAVERIRQVMAAAPTDDPISRVQYTDLKTYLPGDILTKVDRASMAHALEVRVPILDHKFAEWTGTIPAGAKLKGREGKAIFKKALEPLLPEEVLYRPKMGFGVPLSGWFRGPARERVLASLKGEALRGSGLFEVAAIDRLVDRHMSGLSDHTQPIWALLMFAGFLEQVHAAPSLPAAGETEPVAAAVVA